MALTSGSQTDGSTTFDPEKFFQAWESGEVTPPYDNNLRRFIIRAFGLSMNDDYQYQATSAVTLLQAQTYIEFGAQGGLHAWYRDDEGKEVRTPHFNKYSVHLSTESSLKRSGANEERFLF